jgi:glycosyltransferase involved in cell wall biosynthesis
LFLINDLCLGGAERTLLSYVNHASAVRPVVGLLRPAQDLLAELDPDVELATLSGSLPPDRTAPPRPAHWPRRGQPRGRMLLETPALALQVPRLVRLARARHCPVISTFLNRAHTLALLALAVDPELRVVINVHEMLSHHLDIHFAKAERRIMREFIRRTFPRARAIVAVSEGVKSDLAASFGIDPELVTVVHNPLDLARIRRAGAEPMLAGAESPGDDGPLIVAVGRLVHLKGFDLLIRAVARLPRETRARLVIVGEGEARPELERLVGELGVADRVELAGARIEPWSEMRRAQVVAVPSRSEAFPSVIGEAMALGRPVIAARCSEGVAEYLEHGRSGMLVPPDDVDALSAGLAQLLADEALRGRLGAEGLRRVEAFALAPAVARYERLLVSVGEA